ncbi:hypothetical protein ACILFN_00730 [Capnocytophaga canimorsus]|uniref:hypothetical protein n=1 Tax=Capnocytophaga canimorsus TaxID=28188 RepID=UPI0015625A8C|nr:hypothetical protein [Capnocytophaga canimorsus]
MKKMKLLVAALLLVGCSKDNANSEGENHQSFVYPKKVVQTYTQKDYEAGKEVVNNYRKEEENQIENDKILATTQTIFKNGKKHEATKIIFFYENDLLKNLVITDLESGKQTFKGTFSYQDGKLIEKTEERSNKGGTNIITYTYTYEGDKLVKIEKKRSENSKIIRKFTYPSDNEIKEVEGIVATDGGPVPPSDEKTYTLDAQKRVVKSVVNNNSVYEYQYDDKKNILHVAWSLKIFPDYFIDVERMKNNLVHTKLIVDNKEMETTQYNYQYHSNGYPVRVVKDLKRHNESSPETSITEFTY